MPTILSSSLCALAAVGSLASPALADKPSLKAKKPNFGESFDLKQRRSAPPRDVDPPVVVRSLSDSQTDRVIKNHVEDLEYCWLKLPASRRTTTAATLHVTIEAIGNVADARVEGELPTGVAKCMSLAASKWRFPVTDARTELEHGITLTTTK